MLENGEVIHKWYIARVGGSSAQRVLEWTHEKWVDGSDTCCAEGLVTRGSLHRNDEIYLPPKERNRAPGPSGSKSTWAVAWSARRSLSDEIASSHRPEPPTKHVPRTPSTEHDVVRPTPRLPAAPWHRLATTGPLSYGGVHTLVRSTMCRRGGSTSVTAAFGGGVSLLGVQVSRSPHGLCDRRCEPFGPRRRRSCSIRRFRRGVGFTFRGGQTPWSA